MTEQQIPSLSEVYKDYFTIGAAVNPLTIETQKQLLKDQFNSMTCENEMKFESVHPEEERYTFEKADKIAAFAAENGMKMRGHTLVWHNQTPNWMFTGSDGKAVDRATLFARMKSHMETVMGRYRDRIYAWDVVNEAVTDGGEALLRQSKWLEIGGEGFIDQAFRTAHEVDPNALLFYNDYNATHPQKRDKIYTLVKSMLDKGVPIHGIGMQGHWNIAAPSVEQIREAIEKYASLGVKLHITELDVSVFPWNDKRTELKEPEEGMMEKQAKAYEAYFSLLREYRDVIQTVTFWGAADDYTWLDDFPVRGRKNWPFVFDTKHQPKEAFWKIAQF